MNVEQMEAVRALADFARQYAEKVFTGTPDAMLNTVGMLDAADIAESYLDES